MLNFSKSTLAVMAAVLAAAASSANAAIVFTGGNATIVSDTGDRHTVASTLPVPVDYTTPLTGLYGTPTVTEPTGVIKFNFTSLSSQFRATASSALYNASESVDIDGKLVLLVHFNTPTTLSASLYEDGLYSTTNGGSFQILGGGVAIEAVNPPPLETHSGTFTSTAANGGWTATTAISGFTGAYTDYQITIDNNLLALAPKPTGDAGGVSTADIYKKDFILTLNPNGGSGRTPEPASIGVIALGGLGLLARRRK